MREIKFREWDGKRFNYWGLGAKFDKVFTGKVNPSYPDSQYTGLKDKNGVEIYEGDIVKTQVWAQINDGVSRGDWYTGEIMYSKGSFYGHFHKPEVMEYLQFFRYEVIGNIYENPELLK